MFLYNSDIYKRDLNIAIASVQGIECLRDSSVLITGATGLIGSFVTDMLLEYNSKYSAGIKVYAIGRSLARLSERFDGAPDGNLHLIEHDVNNPPCFDFSFDYIIHAASNAYPAAYANDPVGTILSNILGTDYLLEYAKNHGTKRFLFVSSGEVYGEGEPGLSAFKENYSGYVDPTQPRSCYPASKRAAENLCVSYTKQFGLDTVIVRPCHIYGPNTTKTDNRASVQFVTNAMAGEDIIMKSKGLQMRSYCYVADCASALLTVLLKGNSCEAYNIANPDAKITIAGFAQTVAEITGRKVVFAEPSNADKSQQTLISYAVLDSSKLCSLGWTGKYSVAEGINNIVNTINNQ